MTTYTCTCGGAGPRGGCHACRIQMQRTGSTERKRKRPSMTVEEAENLTFDEWLRLSEHQRNAVVAAYYGSAPQTRKPNECQRGHEFTEENTRIVNGKRLCVACDRWRNLNRRKRAF